MSKSTKLVALWEATGKSGNEFFASNRITFGELRTILKDFKEKDKVSDSDEIVFYLFPYESENDKAPCFHLNFKKDNYKKD